MKAITIGETTYDDQVLAGMSTTALADLYNTVAKSVNSKTVNRFADKASAVRRVSQLLSYADEGGETKEKGAAPAEAAPKKTKAARAKKAATETQPKERKKRGRRFVFPVGDEIKKPKTGHRLKMFELCSRAEGASFKELMHATFADAKKSPELSGNAELQDKATYECIRLLHYYNGYGLRQSEDGNIHVRGK